MCVRTRQAHVLRMCCMPKLTSSRCTVVLVWPRPRRSTCIDLRNAGWPGVVYCEEDALHRMAPRNVIMQRSDARTAKYNAFELERLTTNAAEVTAPRPLPALQPTF